MKEGPLVSIIIPSFNSRNYITETLDSVMQQTYSHWEVLLIDDCSTDGSYEVALQYQMQNGLGERMQVHKLTQNSGGPAMPRNEGLKRAKGEYVAFLDADDIWHPQKLELQIYYAHQHHAEFIASEIRMFRTNQEITDELRTLVDKSNLNAKKISHARLLYKNVIPTSSVLIKHALITAYTFNIDQRYTAIEDYHMWLRLLQKDCCCYKLHRILSFYRLSPESISRSKFEMLKKNYVLYNTYTVSGRSLGVKKYFYLCSYIFFSVLNRIIRRRV